MNPRRSDLLEKYRSALQDYLAGQGETALQRAYELGRKAIAEEQGVLDMDGRWRRSLDFRAAL